jgi:hypothetical protein
MPLNFQKTSGEVSAQASTDPGPSSKTTPTPIEVGVSHAFQPATPRDPGLTPASSSAQITSNPYIWNTQTGGWSSYPMVHPSHSGPTFPSVSPLQTYPMFASTMFTHPQIAASLPENISSSSGVVVPPVLPDTRPTERTQLLAHPQATPSPSPHSPSESPSFSDGSESDSDKALVGQKSSKRIRISRRNPTHGFVEGAMVGNKEYCKSIVESLLVGLPRLVYSHSTQKCASRPTM